MLNSTLFQLSSSQIVHNSIDGEILVLDLNNNNFYILQKSAAEVWDKLIVGKTLLAETSQLDSDCTNSKELATNKLEIIVNFLVSENLLVPNEGNYRDSIPQTVISLEQAKQAGIEKFSNLEELLLKNAVLESTALGWPNIRSKAD